MNIVVLRFPYQSALGGEEYHTLDVMCYMKEKGHSVAFFGSCPILYHEFQKNGFRSKKIWGLKMPVTFCTLLFFFLFWPIQLMVILYNRQFMFGTQSTTVYCTSLIDKLLVTPLALYKRCPVIWVEHQGIGNWLQKSPLRFLYIYLSKKVKIIPISPYNTRVLRKTFGVPATCLAPIIHGIHIAEFLGTRLVDDVHLHIGYTGRLEQAKGLQYAIEAVALLYSLKPTIQLTLVGSGGYSTELQALITKFNADAYIRIISPLSRPEYVQFLQSLAVFILPSLDERETFGLSAAEAIVAGAQLVVTNVSGIAQILPANSTALVIPPASVSTLQTGIEQAIALHVSRSTILQTIAVQLFNKQRMLTEYEQLFTQQSA